MRLLEPTSGTIRYDGRDISHISRRELKPLRREMQLIFQDPYSSLNPRKTVGAIIAEPFAIHGIEKGRTRRRQAVQELMEQVGLNPEHYNRYPHEFSGGQRQRIGVARALALKPKLVIADEPVSALDVSIQAQILNLLRDLQQELGLTLILIAHDLSVVRHMCDRIAVMYLGKIVELAENEALYAHPAPSLHRRAAVGGAGARPAPCERAPARRAARRRAEPDQPSAGLPLPPPLPQGAGRSARRRSRRSSPRAGARSPHATSRSRRRRQPSEWQPPRRGRNLTCPGIRKSRVTRRESMRRVLVVTLAALAVAISVLVMSACGDDDGGGSSGSDSQGQRGGTLTMLTNGDVDDALDPGYSYYQLDFIYSMAVQPHGAQLQARRPQQGVARSRKRISDRFQGRQDRHDQAQEGHQVQSAREPRGDLGQTSSTRSSAASSHRSRTAIRAFTGPT